LLQALRFGFGQPHTLQIRGSVAAVFDFQNNIAWGTFHQLQRKLLNQTAKKRHHPRVDENLPIENRVAKTMPSPLPPGMHYGHWVSIMNMTKQEEKQSNTMIVMIPQDSVLNTTSWKFTETFSLMLLMLGDVYEITWRSEE